MGTSVLTPRTLSDIEVRIIRHLATHERAAGADFINTFEPEDMKKLKGTLYPRLLRPLMVTLKAGAGVLYPALVRLETDGLVWSDFESQKDADGHGLGNYAGPAPRRRYYNLTDAGRARAV